MIPIKDAQPHRRLPLWTYSLVAANVLVFVYELLLGKQLGTFVARWGFVPARFFYSYDWPTLFSSMFMHAGWLHILGNMLYLWIFGDNVEDVLGRLYFPAFYLLCGVAAVFAHAALFPDSRVPLIGASGAISGVLGAYVLFFPKTRVLTLVFFGFIVDVWKVPAWVYLLFWFGLQALNGALSMTAGGGAGVAYLAHVGGFVAGVLLALPVYIIRKSLRLYPWTY